MRYDEPDDHIPQGPQPMKGKMKLRVPAMMEPDDQIAPVVSKKRDAPSGKFTHGRQGVNTGEVGKKWNDVFQK